MGGPNYEAPKDEQKPKENDPDEKTTTQPPEVAPEEAKKPEE